jgi:hypothetical protein
MHTPSRRKRKNFPFNPILALQTSQSKGPQTGFVCISFRKIVTTQQANLDSPAQNFRLVPKGNRNPPISRHVSPSARNKTQNTCPISIKLIITQTCIFNWNEGTV